MTNINFMIYIYHITISTIQLFFVIDVIKSNTSTAILTILWHYFKLGIKNAEPVVEFRN